MLLWFAHITFVGMRLFQQHKPFVNLSIVLALCFLLTGQLYAQPLQIHYYNQAWEPCTIEEAAYYRQIRYDDRGKPKGEVRDYYMNGRLQWIGKLLQDKPEDVLDSICTWFNEQGKIIEQSTYTNGLLNGPYFMVDNKGNIDSGLYVAGKKQGLWRNFNSHGTLIKKETYNEDKRNGLVEQFDEDELLVERSEYFNGQLHGASKTYKSGRLSELTHYRHGLKEGVCKSYNSYGLLLDSSYYIDGLISGCRISYDEYTYPARKKEEWDYLRGQIQQYCKYDTAGNLILKEEYQDEKLIRRYPAVQRTANATYARDSTYISPDALLNKYWSWYSNGQLKEYKEYSRADLEQSQFFLSRHELYNEAGIVWASLAWDTLGLYIHKDYDNCLYGLKNKKKQWVVKPIYSNIRETAQGYIAFLAGKAAFLSRSGRQVLPPLFDECVVLVNPRYPYAKESQSEAGVQNVGPFKQLDQFYLLSHLDTFFYLKVRTGEYYGLYSISGRMLYDTVYKQIDYDWTHGLKLSRNEQTEYVYRNGNKVILPFKWVQKIESKEDFFVYADKEENYQRKVGLLHRSGKTLSGLNYSDFRGYSHGCFLFLSYNDTAMISLLDSNGVERLCIAEENIQLINRPSEIIVIRGRDHLYRLYDPGLNPLSGSAFNNVILQDSALVLEENGKKGFYDLQSRRFFPCLYEKLYLLPGQPVLLAQEGNTLRLLHRQSGVIQSMKNTICLYADTYLFFVLQDGQVSGYTTHTQTPVPPEVLFPDSLNELSTAEETFWIDHTGRIVMGGENNKLEKAASNLYKWSNKSGQVAWIRRGGTFVLPFGPYQQINTENPFYYQVSTGAGRQGLLERNGKMLLDTLYAAISHPFSQANNSYCWVVLYNRLTPGVYLKSYEDPDQENNPQDYSYPYEGSWQLYNISTQTLCDSLFQFPYTFSPQGYARVADWTHEGEGLFNVLDLSGQFLFRQAVEDWLEAGTHKYFKQGNRWYRYKGKKQKAEQLPYDLIKDAGLCSGKRNIYVEKNGWANLLDEQGQELLHVGEERISRLLVFKDYSCSFPVHEIFNDEQSYTLFRSLPLLTRLYLDSLIFKELEQESYVFTTDRAWAETEPVFGMREAQEEVNRWVWSREESTRLLFSLEQTTARAYALWVQVENSSTASRGPGQYEAYTYYKNFYLYNGRLYAASLPRLFKVNDAFKAFIFKQAHRYMDEHGVPEEECNTPQQFYNKVKDNFTIGKNGITFFLNNLEEQNSDEEGQPAGFTVSYAMLKPWILSVPLLTAISSK